MYGVISLPDATSHYKWGYHIFKTLFCRDNPKSAYDVAHSIGVQNRILPFPFTGTDFLRSGHFFVLKLGMYVRLVKSLSILSFYLSKQLKESSRTQNLGVKRL